MGLVRPTYQCVPSHRAPGVTAGSGVAPPASSAARPGELGAGDSLPRAELSGVKSDALLPAAARARSTRCRWFLACSARSIHGQPSGSAAAERLPRGELPSCPRDPRACGATGEVVGVVGRGSLYYGYTTYLLWLCYTLQVSDTSKLAERDQREHLNLVFIGHVDAGKSTFCGQILYRTGQVDARTIEKYEKEAKEKNRESWFLAFIMDTNEEERAKGKTVEVGRAHFESATKRSAILGPRTQTQT